MGKCNGAKDFREKVCCVENLEANRTVGICAAVLKGSSREKRMQETEGGSI